MREHKVADRATVVVITLTIGLFIAALAVKGFTHDLFLEGAVFLVSAKLILMAKKNAETGHRLERQLEEIKALVERSIRLTDVASPAYKGTTVRQDWLSWFRRSRSTQGTGQ